jgi:hypothetical protein
MSRFALGIDFFLDSLQNFRNKRQEYNQKKEQSAVKKSKGIFKRKERTVAYLLHGGVSLWWAMIYLFIPLYIIENNLSNLWVGYFLFAILAVRV